MDKNVLQEKQRLLKEKENFEHRETHLGQGVADLFNKVVPEHELAIVKDMIDEAITGAINASY